MFYGPFNIKVSRVAELIDLDSLPLVEKEVLSYGVRYDSATHDVFRFFVMPVFQATAENIGTARRWSRKTKRVSYSLADAVLIQTLAGSTEITLLGIHPTTTKVTGESAFDLEAEAILEIGKPGTFHLKLSGKAKNSVRKTEFRVMAPRTNDLAQWVFFKPWIEAGESFCLEYLCFVPKGLEAKERFIRCDVKVEQKGRAIGWANGRTVTIPSP